MQASILGVSDGLVSTLALILGVAGAGSGPATVRLAGFAGLIAGACSLAVSQYIATQAWTDRRRALLKGLRGFDRLDPHARERVVRHELTERGVGRITAHTIAGALVNDVTRPSALLGFLRYGLNPRDRSSPLHSAFAAFVTSAIGALVPLLPWLFLSGHVAAASSAGTAAVAALVIGAMLGNDSDGNWLRGALRQCGLVLLAAFVAYGLGLVLAIVIS